MRSSQEHRQVVTSPSSSCLLTTILSAQRVVPPPCDSGHLVSGEPFDFLTWFEYAPEDAGAFEDLVGSLRGTEEWTYVEREVDIRLAR